LYAIGEANFSDHGANRLGASALMQGLADGYFVLPYTIADYLSDQIHVPRFTGEEKEFTEVVNEVNARIEKLMNVKGTKSVDSFHKRLGHIMWDHVGMARNEEGLKKALEEIPKIKEEFWKEVFIPGNTGEYNTELEKAGRVIDFLELGELMARDALNRTESCGGHFREESQTPEGEAMRDDDNFAYVSAWEYKGEGVEPQLHKEHLTFEAIKLVQRNYK
jgi:succinate dehydrogenase / fumarate reductase flavoprotein subunit